jgi:Xaa-Pro aminopeptidase
MAAGPTEVRWVGPDPAATVTATVAELLGLPRARRRRRLGLVGPLPYRIHRALAGGLAGYELVDASGSFVRHRLVKGADEIARTHRAAALADLAITTLIRELRPGLREHEVGAILEAAYRRAGGEHGICFLASASMRAPTAIVPSQLWSARRIRSGDLVMLELSVGWGGGWSQILRTFTLGEPTEVVRRLHGVADAAFAAISDRVRPGTTAADLLASAEGIDAAGFTVVDDVVHGYGGGYLPPILRTPATQRRPPPDLALRPGMMLVVQPNVVTSDQRLGVQTGELLIVTADGHERPHRTPLGLVVV